MNTSQLLQELSDDGIRLWEKDGKLQFRAPKGAINENIKKEISKRKNEIISLLKSSDHDHKHGRLSAEPDLENRYTPFPLSDVQSAYLIGRNEAFELGNIACHSYYELEQSELDIKRLNSALNKLIQKHETLKLIFMEDGTQIILKKVPQYKINVSDLRDLDEENAKRQHDNIREDLSHKIHNAGQWPLFEAGVILFKDYVRLYFSLDLLAADFFSAFILFRDLVKYYDDPEAECQPVEFSFRDYVLKEHELAKSKQFLTSRDYWMNRIDSFPLGPQLPFAKEPGTIKKPQFVRREFILDRALWSELKKKSANYELTPSVVLMTAYSEILSRWSKTNHFAINLTLFNRLPVHADVMNIAGDFTCVNLLEVNTGTEKCFKEKAKIIQNRLWEDLDNRHFSGIKFIRELARLHNAEGKALMPVVFSSTIGVENKNLTDFEVKRLGSLKYGITQTPQVFLDHQVIEHEERLFYNWDAVEAIFPENLLDDMFEAYTNVIVALSKEETAWNGSIDDLISVKSPVPWMDGEDEKGMSQEMLHTLFEKQANNYPEKNAVITSDRTLSYKELNVLSSQIGEMLRNAGALPGKLVGVLMEKGWEQVAGALGILKSGAAYLPIDPKVPIERLNHLLTDGGVHIVLTQSKIRNSFPWPEHLEIYEVDKINGDGFHRELLEPVQSPDDLAYVIYTSGSTGLPKGVMIDHKSAVNTILDVNDRFAVTTDDKVFSLAAMNFDLSVYDFFGTLAAGATIIIPDHKRTNDPAHWLSMINAESITVWNSVPQLMQMLTEYLTDREDDVSDSLRLVMMSGDWIPLDLPAKIRSIFHNADIYSLGGATEASIWSICYPIKEINPCWKSIPYGRSMKNQNVYVLNKNLEFCPVWVTGDLYIEGRGLAKGYLNDKEKTDASFIIHPKTRQRLYKTGDLGRYLPDGNIEFLGREDAQVKIRGYRVELGEIEAAIKQHSGIKDAVVLPAETKYSKRYLNGFVTLKDGYQISIFDADSHKEIKDILRKILPEYMIPLNFKVFDKFPLSSNGKIDRSKLFIQEKEVDKFQNEYIAPRTHNEMKMVEIWQRHLLKKQIGIHENFFEIGGDSLIATKLMSEIRKTYKVELTLSTLFEYSTIAELISHITTSTHNCSATNSSALSTINTDLERRYEPFPLTDTQEAYWIGRNNAFELGNTSTHMYLEIEMEDAQIESLEKAWQRMITRHEMLRAIILEDGRQRILENVPLYKFRINNLCSMPERFITRELGEIRKEMSHQILHPEEWPLFDIRISIINLKKIRLHIKLDAIIIDAWSIFSIFNEWNRLYLSPNVNLPDIDVSFRDYLLTELENQHSDLYKRDKAYWMERLPMFPSAPELPYAISPASIKKPYFKRFTGILKVDKWQRLKSIGQQNGLTPSCILLAAYAEIIYNWSRSDKFTLNLTLFNRLPLHPDVNEVIGDFTSITLLSIDRSNDDKFMEFAHRVQKQLWEDIDHRQFSGIKVLRELAKEHNAPGKALMPVVFTSALSLGSFGQDASSVLNKMGQFIYGIAQTPQVILDHQVMEDNGDLVFNWDAVDEVFPEGMLDDMFGAYCQLIEKLADEKHTWKIEHPKVIPEPQIQLRKIVNNTVSAKSDEMLHTLFNKQAMLHPEKEAIVTPTLKMNYNELAKRSKTIGRLLQIEGIKPNTLVAIVMEKGWEQVVAVLGVLYSGAAYLPVDPSLPKERLHHILKNGKVDFILTQSWLGGEISKMSKGTNIFVDRLEIFHEEECLFPVQKVDDLAYVIYTSGSTGQPKGVMIDHQGAVNTILDINRMFSVNSQDRVLALAALNFDLSVYDIFGTLAAGGTIIIPESQRVNDPAYWSKLIQSEHITVWNSVPQLMQMLTEYKEAEFENDISQCLRLVLLSGDWVPVDLPKQIKSVFKNAKIVSLGGATEASIWSIFYPIEHENLKRRSIPYGQPMCNQKVYVLNGNMGNCPDWKTGELYIGGIGLAKGYWDDKIKTKSVFINHPETGERLYKTGDLGRYLPDGNIEFIGRNDFQVKIRGNRVELGEIEFYLTEHPLISKAVVVTAGEIALEKRLVAHIITEGALTIEAVRSFLSKKLPNYCIPSAINIIDSIPVTANGKIDRKKLGKFKFEKDEVFKPASTKNEKLLLEIWSEIFGIKKISVNSNFFELGGSSFDAIRIITLIRKKMSIDLSLTTFFEKPTISKLSNFIENSTDQAKKIAITEGLI